MIIVDLNQISISNLMAQIGNHTNAKIEESLVRHMVLNTLRSIKTKFQEYGEMIIACDAKHCWRRDAFPYYKANRKKSREQSELDWPMIFDTLNKIKEELREFFPYRVIQVDGAEADDVIGTLVLMNGKMLSINKEILIVSGDKDFAQLQRFSNVAQYDPVKKKFVTCTNPDTFLKEHILKGDRGDGIPNILSPDSCFVRGDRQKPMTAKKLDQYINMPLAEMDEALVRNYKRNEQLIDLLNTPEEIREKILEQYQQQNQKGREKLFNYFISYKLKNLMEHVGEF